MSLHARLVAYEPNGSRLGVLTQPSSWDASFIHDEVGALSVQYSREAFNGDILKRGLEQGLEIAVEVASDGSAWSEPLNARFILTSRSRNALDQSDTVTLTMPSYSWLFNKILNMNTEHLETDGDNKGKRAFLAATPGTVLRTFFDENWETYKVWDTANIGFDTGRDSGGDTWAKKYTLYYSAGTSMNSVFSSFVGGAALDWRVDGRVLKVWNYDSTKLCRDLSNSVFLHLRLDVTDAPEEETIDELASDVLVTGDNNLVFTEHNNAAPTPWGRWQAYYSQGGVSQEATAKNFMQAELELASRVRGQYTRSVDVNVDDSLPLVDYRPGDWISAPTVNHGEKVRVQQVTLSMSDKGLTCSIVLCDKFYDASIRQYRRIVGITGGAKLAGSENGTANDGTDHRVPKAPEGLVVDTDAYIGSNGYARGVAYAVWGEVTQATDNTAIDISNYRVQWKYSGDSDWRFAGLSDDTSLSWGDLDCGRTIIVRVQAVPTYSDKSGLWSNEVSAVVQDDVTPPSIPSKPILSSSFGGVIIHWDGKNQNGGGMEADFDHLVVERGESAGSMEEIETSPNDKGDWLDFSDLVPGKEYWYALAAVDHAGNQSDWSEAASVIVVSVVSQEQVDQIQSDLDKANEELDQAQNDITDANKQLDQVQTDLSKAETTVAEQNKVISQAQSDITQLQGKTDEVSQQAAQAIENALNAQKTADGKNNIFHDWQDPRITDPTLVPTVGDQWYRYQRYWTTSLGEQDNSPSALADFVTYSQGEPDNSPSVLETLDSRLQEILIWDGTDWVHFTFAASDIIATGSIVASNIKTNAITSEKILAGAITAEKIAALSVTADKIAANSITSDKIVSGSIIADKLASNSVTSDKIVSNAITTAKLASGSVTSDKIVANAITSDKIAANSVTGVKIAARTISADRIAAGAITSYELHSSCITSDKIVSGAITADKIAANAINGKTITGCTINGGVINSTSSKGTLKISNGEIRAYPSSGVEGGYINYGVGQYGGMLHIHGPQVYISGPQLWLNCSIIGQVSEGTNAISGWNMPNNVYLTATRDLKSNGNGSFSWQNYKYPIWQGFISAV